MAVTCFLGQVQVGEVLPGLVPWWQQAARSLPRSPRRLAPSGTQGCQLTRVSHLNFQSIWQRPPPDTEYALSPAAHLQTRALAGKLSFLSPCAWRGVVPGGFCGSQASPPASWHRGVMAGSCAALQSLVIRGSAPNSELQGKE